jgi:hypothetical protein
MWLSFLATSWAHFHPRALLCRLIFIGSPYRGKTYALIFTYSPEEGKFYCFVNAGEGKSTPSSPPALPWCDRPTFEVGFKLS